MVVICFYCMNLKCRQGFLDILLTDELAESQLVDSDIPQYTRKFSTCPKFGIQTTASLLSLT